MSTGDNHRKNLSISCTPNSVTNTEHNRSETLWNRYSSGSRNPFIFFVMRTAEVCSSTCSTITSYDT